MKKDSNVLFWIGLGLLVLVPTVIILAIYSVPIVLLWIAIGPEMIQFATEEPGIFGIFIAMALVVAWIVNRYLEN